MRDVIHQPARRHSAPLGIGKRQEIVLHQPDDVRGHDEKCQHKREPWSGRCKMLARVAIEHDE